MAAAILSFTSRAGRVNVAAAIYLLFPAAGPPPSLLSACQAGSAGRRARSFPSAACPADGLLAPSPGPRRLRAAPRARPRPGRLSPHRPPVPASRLGGRPAEGSGRRRQPALLLRQERPSRARPPARRAGRGGPQPRWRRPRLSRRPVRLRPPRGQSSRSALQADSHGGAELGPSCRPGRRSAAAAGGEAVWRGRVGGAAGCRGPPAADGGAAGHRCRGPRPPAGEGAAGVGGAGAVSGVGRGRAAPVVPPGGPAAAFLCLPPGRRRRPASPAASRFLPEMPALPSAFSPVPLLSRPFTRRSRSPTEMRTALTLSFSSFFFFLFFVTYSYKNLMQKACE